MRNNLFLFLLLVILLVLSCNPQPKRKVFDYPAIGSSNTDLMEIYHIEITDTALILHAEVYNRPNHWIRLSSQSYVIGETTGKTYKLTGSPDFELDKEVKMPDSWNKTVTLLFEPVDDSEKVISYYDGNGEDDFYKKNIQIVKPDVNSKITCIIEGQTIDRPYSSRLILIRKGEDFRTNPFISIPIRDGKFRYELNTDISEIYELCFWDEYMSGGWRPSYFIAENGHLNFTFFPMEHKPHVVLDTKAPLNEELLRVNHMIDTMFDFNSIYNEYERLHTEGRLYSEAYKQWTNDINTAETEEERMLLYRKQKELMQTGLAYTKEGRDITERGKRLAEKLQQFKLNYAKEHTDMVGYYFLNDLLYQAKMSQDTQDMTPYIEVFQSFYGNRYPNHPLSEEINRFISSMEIKTGNKYIDFTAPDLEGNPVQLSGQINGKIALIDLWASWCGPCRRTSISMIPVYEKYKDKGFTIVGVARERDNTAAMKKAIAHDKYPWLNLVELDDSGKIWDVYGVGNAGGKTFLVDTDGIILAVHPTAEEVKAILSQKLDHLSEKTGR